MTKRNRVRKLFGLFLFVLVLVLVMYELQRRAGSKRPNIVLVSIDTVRADHLSVYGYKRPTAPGLKRLAAKGVLFRNAIAQAPWTLPSMATLHTALYPREHGAVIAEAVIDEGITTVAETLKQAGYHTMAVVSHTFVDRAHGFAQGFDEFDQSQIRGYDAVTSEEVTRIALEMERSKDKQPYFLWVHYFDPHYLYVRHPDFDFSSDTSALKESGKSHAELEMELYRKFKGGQLNRREDLDYVRAVYDEEIAYTDYWVDRLLTALADRHPGHETVCVVTADHGEFFGEHGRFLHGRDVYQPVIHVPLIIGGGINEELQGSAVEMPVALRNVPQTILHLAGVDNAPFAGADLLSIAHTSGFPAYVFTEASYPFGEDDRKTAVQDGTWKLIHNLDPDTYELYCLDTDPGELENLWHAEAPQAIEQKEQLAKVLQEFNERATVTAPQTTLSDDTLEHLRSLGYTR